MIAKYSFLLVSSTSAFEGIWHVWEIVEWPDGCPSRHDDMSAFYISDNHCVLLIRSTFLCVISRQIIRAGTDGAGMTAAFQCLQNCSWNDWMFLTSHWDIFQLGVLMGQQEYGLLLMTCLDNCGDRKRYFWQDLLIICLWKLGIFDETGHCFSSVCGKKVDICWYMLGKICSCEPYILNEVLWHFPAVFLATELNIFDEMSGLFAVEKQVFLMKRWGIF